MGGRGRRYGSRPAGRRNSLAPAVAAVVLLGMLGGCSGSAGTPSSATGQKSTTAGRSPTPPASAPGTPPPSGPGAPPAPATALDARVAAALGRLDARHRVAQLFVVGVPLTDLSGADALLYQGVGGIFLLGRSTMAAADLGAVTERWSAGDRQLRPWVACDQEGGRVQTLTGPGFPPLPAAREQGSLPAEQRAALADGLGRSLATAGVNLDLAPVADVVPASTEAGNAPIGAFGRQYGSTPAQVVTAARTVIHGLGGAGVTATVKHFPGLGRVQANTDTAQSVVDGVTAAGDEQVAVFGELAREPQAPFVMLSSAVYTRIDPGAPAMFSRAVVSDLLRTRLGFSGVAITDDVGTAKAVSDVPAGERAVRLLAAGGTLVLTVTAKPLPAMIDAVLARAAANPAFAAQVDAAVRTALLAKARAGLLA